MRSAPYLVKLKIHKLMKFKTLISILFTLAIAFGSQAQGLSDILGKLGSGKGKDILSTIGNAAATNDFDLSKLKGTWTYSSPAVSFKSGEALSDIGGAAVATQIENRLAPYFKTAGLTGLTMTFDGKNNFVAKIKGKEVKGHIERDSVKNEIYFFFDRLGKTSNKGVKAMVTKAGTNVNITLDASKVLELAQKVSGTLNLSSMKQISALLARYKGAYVGIRLKK